MLLLPCHVLIYIKAQEYIYEPVFKHYSTLEVRYRDLQARVYKQETRNLTFTRRSRAQC